MPMSYLTFFKFKVMEGTSVTLLGMVNYDSETNSLTMTHLTSLFAGSLSEVSRTLQEKIEMCYDMREDLLRFMGLCAFIAGISIALGTGRLWRALGRKIQRYRKARMV